MTTFPFAPTLPPMGDGRAGADTVRLTGTVMGAVMPAVVLATVTTSGYDPSVRPEQLTATVRFDATVFDVGLSVVDASVFVALQLSSVTFRPPIATVWLGGSAPPTAQKKLNVEGDAVSDGPAAPPVSALLSRSVPNCAAAVEQSKASKRSDFMRRWAWRGGRMKPMRRLAKALLTTVWIFSLIPWGILLYAKFANHRRAERLSHHCGELVYERNTSLDIHSLRIVREVQAVYVRCDRSPDPWTFQDSQHLIFFDLRKQPHH